MSSVITGLEVVEVASSHILEGPRAAPCLADDGDVTRLLEACFAAHARMVLLYATNLPAAFFDLSSGVAGAVLQRLRNYGVRLAVVRESDGPAASSRFAEMVAEERQGRFFGMFATRDDAIAWLVEEATLTWPT